MALINYTSPNVNNTASSDAIKHFGQIGASGIFKIDGATLSSTNNNGLITFSKGYVSIQGRFLEMERGTTFNVSLTGGAYGYVCIKYDWQLQEATIINIEATDDYPTLTQPNMVATNDGEYYLPICKYTKTSTSLTLEELDEDIYLESYTSQIKSLIDKDRSIYIDRNGYTIIRYADGIQEIIGTKNITTRLESVNISFSNVSSDFISFSDYPFLTNSYTITSSIERYIIIDENTTSSADVDISFKVYSGFVDGMRIDKTTSLFYYRATEYANGSSIAYLHFNIVGKWK